MNTDFKNEVYIQTQNWARHNETLIIAANTILIGAAAAIATVFFKSHANMHALTICIPLSISIIGIFITLHLSKQYCEAITRIVVYEKYFGMHQTDHQFNLISKEYSKPSCKWTKGFVPNYLHSPPTGAASTKIFIIINSLIAISCILFLAHSIAPQYFSIHALHKYLIYLSFKKKVSGTISV